VQGLPQPPATGSVKEPSSHGKRGGGSSGEEGGVALHRYGVRPTRPPWQRGRVSCSVKGPFAWGWAVIGKAQSTSLSALCTAGPTNSHLLLPGKSATCFARLPWSASQQSSQKGRAKKEHAKKPYALAPTLAARDMHMIR
jgi:hypothetical protein